MALLDQITACWCPRAASGFRIIDFAPLRNHMVWSNMPTTALRCSQFQGKSFYCVNYDGVDDFASVPANANYALSTTKAISFSIWMRTSSSGNWCPFSRSLAGIALSRIALFRANDVTRLFLGGGGSDSQITMPDSLHNGQWHLASATYDLSGTFRGYVDGVKIGEASYTPTFAGSYATIIGKYNDGGGGIGDGIYQFPGDIAEVNMWSRAVADAEWAALYVAGPNAVSRMLATQAFPRRRISQAIAAGGATPWLYARRRSQVIGSGGVH